MIRFSVLASGSNANSVYVEIDRVGILLDAGLGIPTLGKRLASINKDDAQIKHIFISHQHNDHIYGLTGLLKKHPNINVMTFGDDQLNGKEVHLSGFTYIAFRLSHDSPCTGYIIKDNSGNKLGYVPDTGCIPEEAMQHLFDCNALIFEFNHDVIALTESSYPTDLQERIFSEVGHMRNEESGAIVALLAHDRLEYLIPFHLSEKTNSEDLAGYEARAAVMGFRTKVICARQNEPTDFFTLI